MRFKNSISLIFAIWYLSLLLIFYFGFLNFPHSPKTLDNFFENFGQWDGGYYLSIAKDGYTSELYFAFFPVYPLAIKIVTLFTQNYLLSAILISIAASYLALKILFELLKRQFDKKIAFKTILFLLFFPTSFYFLVAYSESLFFLFVVSTFFFLHKKKLFLAVLVASLASATRVSGLALVVALLFDNLTRNGLNKKNWYILLAPSGFLFYSFYLLNQTGDPLYFISSQLHWQRVLSIPGLGFWETIRNLTTTGFISQYPHFLTDLIFAIFGVGMVIRCFRFLPPIYSIYSFLSILLPLLTPSLFSIPRFLLPIFPIFILLGLVKNQYVTIAYQFISIMLLALFSVLFINGYWVS